MPRARGPCYPAPAAAPSDSEKGRPGAPTDAPSARERSGAIPAKVFVGNLNYETTKEELTRALSVAGTILNVYLPVDRATGRPRGFAFVEFSTQEEAQAAIEQFNDFELAGRRLRVNEAQERRGPRPSGPPSDFSFGFNSDRSGGRPPGKPKGSRRGLRGKKRSL